MEAIIAPPGATSITLSFTTFDTEPGLDVLSIFSCASAASCSLPYERGPILLNWSGYLTRGTSVSFKTGAIFLSWVSQPNRTVHKRAGWSASWTVTVPGTSATACPAALGVGLGVTFSLLVLIVLFVLYRRLAAGAEAKTQRAAMASNEAQSPIPNHGSPPPEAPSGHFPWASAKMLLCFLKRQIHPEPEALNKDSLYEVMTISSASVANDEDIQREHMDGVGCQPSKSEACSPVEVSAQVSSVDTPGPEEQRCHWAAKQSFAAQVQVNSELNEAEGHSQQPSPPPSDENRDVLATMLDEVLGRERELGALRDNFERDRKAVLDEEYRRMEEVLSSFSIEAAQSSDLGSSGLHGTFFRNLDKHGQYMDLEYTPQVICQT